MTGPWLSMAWVLVALGGAAGALRWLQRRRQLHPEVARKGFHVSAGLVVLPLPWLFDEAWPVLVLGLVTLLGFAGVRRCRKLRSGPGALIHGVARPSLGELCFPAGVSLAFVLSRGDALLYCVPVLLLTFADPAAALIGIRYGTVRYPTLDGEKTAEGSLAFLGMGFLCCVGALRLVGEAGALEGLLVSAVVALTLTMVEALSAWGLDNLLIPLVGFLVMAGVRGLDAALLAGCLGALAVLASLGWLAFRTAASRPRVLSSAGRSAWLALGFRAFR